MGFGVIYDGEDRCTVYSIRTQRFDYICGDVTEFFVWNCDGKWWGWIDSKRTYPIEEKY
jgi:hypothetical protein